MGGGLSVIVAPTMSLARLGGGPPEMVVPTHSAGPLEEVLRNYGSGTYLRSLLRLTIMLLSSA
jgi:hypothetical protein